MMVFCVSIFAEKTSLKGTVVDETGFGLPGVNVVVKGTTTGTMSDIDGKFNLSVNEASTKTIVFSSMGYATQEVVVGDKEEIKVILKEDAVGLDEVVVTALGIKREKKALGYSQQEVKAEELTAGAQADVTTALQGKVAGVTISASGSGVGGSQRIEIRGNSSLSGKNEPLWIVDGIPFSNKQNGNGGEWGGVDRAGAAFDINPDDIESMSVLKGPNAAALYGSRAANGVIVITTKKGRKNQNLGVTYNSSLVFSDVAYLLDMQNKYGRGDRGVYSVDPSKKSNWGPELDGSMKETWLGEQKPFVAQTGRIEDFYNLGISQKHNLSLQGGNDKGSFRASIGTTMADGITPHHSVDKSNFDLVSDYQINDFMKVSSKVSYVRTEGENRPEKGAYSSVAYLYAMPRDIRLSELEDNWSTIDPVTGDHVEKNWATVDAGQRNPYFVLNQMKNSDTRDRFFGYFAVDFQLMENLTLKVKHGLDIYNETVESKAKYTDKVYANDRPNFNVDKITHLEQNTEFLLSYNKELNKDFDLSLNFGGNRMYTKTDGLYTRSGKLGLEKYYLGLGTNKDATNSITEKEIQSLYGFGQVAYKDFLYLDVTGRNDWSSTLPKSNWSFFYPSVSVSGIVTEALKVAGISYPKEILSFAKLRASYAIVGNDTDPYQLTYAYNTGKDHFNLIYASTNATELNMNLKAEETKSFEIGADVRLFENRIGIDFTYYNSKTSNQILKIEKTWSKGYENAFINAGQISNKGFEVMLSTTPVRSKDLRIDLDFNFATNEGFVDELHPDLKEYVYGGMNNGTRVVATEGRKLGDILGKKYKRDENGNLVVGDGGLPIIDSKESVIGNIQADWTGSVRLAADYKGFFCSALINIKSGGDIVDLTEASSASSGTAKITEDRNPFILDAVYQDGAINSTQISAQDYWENNGIEDHIYDASYVKLGEVSVGYRFGKDLIGGLTNNVVQSAKISLVGTNLAYLYKDTPGDTPDGGGLSNTIRDQAFITTPLPATRTYGVTLNVKF
jgi:TonB-linked SusC/RagA family outer membrane protein